MQFKTKLNYKIFKFKIFKTKRNESIKYKNESHIKVSSKFERASKQTQMFEQHSYQQKSRHSQEVYYREKDVKKKKFITTIKHEHEY